MSRYHLMPCRWRRPGPVRGRQGCASTIIAPGPFGVPDHQCWMCQHIDHRDPDALAEARETGAVRHLLYHVYPVGDVWRWNLAQLRRRLSLFNGRRIVAAAIGPGTARAADVRAELAGLDVEVLEMPNDAELKEMATYPTLLRRLADLTGPADVQFYAHAKGVASEAIGQGVRRWTTAMYESLLDYWPAVRRELHGHCCVGVYRRFWHFVPRAASGWHYSGTFRWIRNTDFYAREWTNWDHNWCGSETHPGYLFSARESACLYGEFNTPHIGLYASQPWDGWAGAAHREWCEAHAADRQEPMLATVILTAHRQRDLVHEAIASVRQQTTDAWQLLIVDAGVLAGDGAYDRYKSDARIQVMLTGETEQLRGQVGMQAWAINEAWRRGRVRGDVVCCLCDDDTLERGWLAELLAAAAARPEQGAWYGAAARGSLLAGGQVVALPGLNTRGVGRPGNLLRGHVDGMQVGVRRSAWVAWSEARELAREADGHWLDQLAARTEIHPLAAVAGVHRHTPLSTFTGPAGQVGVRC